MNCPVDLIQAAADDRLADDDVSSLTEHLSHCDRCRMKLDQSTADRKWWDDASRFLDESVLADPQSDVADSSNCDARLFEDDDPIGELKAIGAIESASHPEMLGQLGRYTIEQEIGSGGMGVVLKAHDAELRRTVAIKILAPHLARSGAAKQRFVREGRAAAAVVHENVVAIHEVDTSGKLPSLVMRYVDGISLQRHVDLYGPLSVFDALRIASQTAAGLAAAHRQGIIHRDVKPANILVNHSCNRAWISDFGLARAVDDASLTRTGFIAGTPHYMSPEQARGGDVGPKSDLFSLGAVIYFMFAARPPWRAERSLAVLHRIVQHDHRPLWKLNAQIPRQVSDLVDRMLCKDESARPESAVDVQEQLEKTLSDLQNPEAREDSSAIVNSHTQTSWHSRPWFVAPLASFLTAAVMWFVLRDPLPQMTSNVKDNPPTQTATNRPYESEPDVGYDKAMVSNPPQRSRSKRQAAERSETFPTLFPVPQDVPSGALNPSSAPPIVQGDRFALEPKNENVSGTPSGGIKLPSTNEFLPNSTPGPPSNSLAFPPTGMPSEPATTADPSSATTLEAIRELEGLLDSVEELMHIAPSSPVPDATATY